MTTRKKLIEVALPLEAINVASAREKSIRHGHPSTLHLWWSRKPLATTRAVIFASLVDDPDDTNALPAFVEACQRLPVPPQFAPDETPTARDRLHYFIERLVQWESTTDEAILNQARELIQIATEGSPPPLLDPFAGGGSIPLEAQRLGLEAHASDLNPVAVMINKAQIEIPPRFANQPPVNPRDRAQMFEGDRRGGIHSAQTWRGAAGLAADVRYYGEWMRERAWERIGHLYPTHNGETVIAWLWARTVRSPNPAVNAHVPLTNKFQLSKKKGRECWARPIIENGTVRFEVTAGKPPEGEDGTMGRQYGGGRCIISGVPIAWDYVREEGKAGRMGVMLMAVVTEGTNGRSYYSPTEADVQSARRAEQSEYWKPGGEMPLKHRNFQPPVYGMYEYGDLFTPRQLVALTTFSDLVAEARAQAHADAIAAGLPDDGVPLRDGGRGALAYAEAVSVYLAFGVDKGADNWSSITSWRNSVDSPRTTFARQALPMVWDYAESNPFSDSAGSWDGTVIEILHKAVDALSANAEGYALQQDAARIVASANTLSTDPPYYDNIGYADLSDYFYVWMRRSLRDIYPEVFSTVLVPKAPELIASPYRHGGKEAANAHFESGMLQTFTNIRRFISTEYPLTVYYAFKQQDAEIAEEDDEANARGQQSTVASTGWETMLASLIQSGFSIVGTWPMRTERGGRANEIGANALASSIVLVCRPRPDDASSASRRQLVDALRRELPPALKELQSGNIAPVDLAQASIGPGMAIYSRYSRVLEADGSPMSVRAALALINQELDAYLAEQDGDIDGDTRFAVAWFEQFGFNEGEFGRADVLARAKNTSVTGVEASGLVVSGRGKVRLIHWSEYDPARAQWTPTADKRPTIWEAVHHLIERLNSHGEGGSALLMTQMPHDMAAEARALAYRLYSICERKGWADHARDYNALVVSWAEIGTRAAEIRQQRSAGDATVQEKLL
jgi:putative DNA methylase